MAKNVEKSGFAFWSRNQIDLLIKSTHYVPMSIIFIDLGYNSSLCLQLDDNSKWISLAINLGFIIYKDTKVGQKTLYCLDKTKNNETIFGLILSLENNAKSDIISNSDQNQLIHEDVSVHKSTCANDKEHSLQSKQILWSNNIQEMHYTPNEQ